MDGIIKHVNRCVETFLRKSAMKPMRTSRTSVYRNCVPRPERYRFRIQNPRPIRSVSDRTQRVRIRNERVVETKQNALTKPIDTKWIDNDGVGLSVVKFGFPKGSLQSSTEDLFLRAG